MINCFSKGKTISKRAELIPQLQLASINARVSYLIWKETILDRDNCQSRTTSPDDGLRGYAGKLLDAGSWEATVRRNIGT